MVLVFKYVIFQSMATRSLPQKLIEKAIEGGLVPLGEYKLRDDETGLVTRYPKRAEELNDVDVDDGVKKFVDQETGATVTIPVDEIDEK